MNDKYLPVFTFRGLLFREYAEGIGVQVKAPSDLQWHNTAVLNRRTLERDYQDLPDIAIWGNRREHLGTIKF